MKRPWVTRRPEEAVIIVCHGCDWEVEVDSGVYTDITPMASAKKRRAGHIAGAGCDAEDVEIIDPTTGDTIT